MTDAASPLKIAIPIHSFEPGGVERVALNLAEAWQARGCEVSVILGRADGAMAEHAPRLRYICEATRISTAPVETLWMIRQAYRFLRDNRVDVLFCPGNTYTIVAVALKRLLGQQCPPIVTKISNDLTRMDMSATTRRAYHHWLRLQGKYIDRFVSMAEPLRQEIADAMAVAVEQVATVPDPALTDKQFTLLSQRLTCTRHSGARHFLAVGRLVEQKNFPLMIRAFANAAPSHATLTILGKGPERAKLETLIAQYGVTGRVLLPGYQADTARWFRTSTALLLSSHYEGVPAVILEALAAGLPIIATNCSAAMPELLGHGQFGVLTPVGDAQAFGCAIASFNAARFHAEGATAFASAYRISHAAAQYQRILQDTAMLAPQRSLASVSAAHRPHIDAFAATQDTPHA